MTSDGDAAGLRTHLVELKQKLRELEGVAQEYRFKRDETNREVKIISLKIRELRGRILELREEISEVRGKKNKLYDQLKAVREERAKGIERARSLREQLRELRDELAHIRSALRGGRGYSEESLKQQIERLEWEYQTRPHSIEEEKYYVERMKSLEALYVNIRRFNEVKNRIMELEEEIREVRGRIDLLTRRRDEVLREYVAFKEKLEELKEEYSRLSSQIDGLRAKRDKLREEADSYHVQYIHYHNEARKLREEIERVSFLLKASELSRRIENRRKAMYSKALGVLEKYRRGEKLSLDEFKLLVEFKLIKG